MSEIDKWFMFSGGGGGQYIQTCNLDCAPLIMSIDWGA